MAGRSSDVPGPGRCAGGNRSGNGDGAAPEAVVCRRRLFGTEAAGTAPAGGLTRIPGRGRLEADCHSTAPDIAPRTGPSPWESLHCRIMPVHLPHHCAVSSRMPAVPCVSERSEMPCLQRTAQCGMSPSNTAQIEKRRAWSQNRAFPAARKRGRESARTKRDGTAAWTQTGKRCPQVRTEGPTAGGPAVPVSTPTRIGGGANGCGADRRRNAGSQRPGRAINPAARAQVELTCIRAGAAARTPPVQIQSRQIRSGYRLGSVGAGPPKRPPGQIRNLQAGREPWHAASCRRLPGSCRPSKGRRPTSR